MMNNKTLASLVGIYANHTTGRRSLALNLSHISPLLRVASVVCSCSLVVACWSVVGWPAGIGGGWRCPSLTLF
jgi:hypothetical protein